MFRQILICAVVASFVMVSGAGAQEPRDFSQVPMETVQLPGTNYAIMFDSPDLQVGEARAMQPLSTALVSWLAANFDLPSIRDLPQVEYAPAIDIAALQSTKRRSISSTLSARYRTLILYYEKSKIIFLPEGWNGNTAAELSMFVRALVRHVQNVAGLEYDCPQARDWVAYVAQRKLLGLFKHNLKEDFEISPEPLVKSQCSLLP